MEVKSVEAMPGREMPMCGEREDIFWHYTAKLRTGE
jgi:hypothetical protein